MLGILPDYGMEMGSLVIRYLRSSSSNDSPAPGNSGDTLLNSP